MNNNECGQWVQVGTFSLHMENILPQINFVSVKQLPIFIPIKEFQSNVFYVWFHQVLTIDLTNERFDIYFALMYKKEVSQSSDSIVTELNSVFSQSKQPKMSVLHCR